MGVNGDGSKPRSDGIPSSPQTATGAENIREMRESTQAPWESCQKREMPEALHLLVDLIPTPIGSLMIAADRPGNLRVALFTEYETVVNRQLQLHYGKT